ncbi:MAG TPA: restriction endonuclease subunit S [Saprospiraceae bacterium]|nr:restriction endonuclease subunit S [Saprospiraceae bacterium]
MMDQNELPKGWEVKKLEEVCEKITDGSHFSPKSTTEGYPYVTVKDIKNDRVDLNNCLKISEDDFLNLAKNDCRPLENDILFSKDGTVGKVALINYNSDFVVLSSIAILRSNLRVVYPKYLFHILKSSNFLNQALNQKKGVAIRRIILRDLKNLSLNLPPLPEQHRIVAKIEALFSQLDNGVTQLKKAKEQLKVYRQAVLKWAFEGRLTNANIKEGELPEGWKWVKIGEYVGCIVPNRDKPKSFSGNIPWLTTPDLDENSISINFSKVNSGLTKEEAAAYKAKIIPIDSVIITCVGKFGVAAVIDSEVVINQQLHAFLPSKYFAPKFIAYNIISQKTYCERKSTSTTIAYLNKENCNSIPIPLCPLAEQHLIIQEIESRLSICDKLEETITQALQQSEALRQSILKRAFEGRLVSGESNRQERSKKR